MTQTTRHVQDNLADRILEQTRTAYNHGGIAEADAAAGLAMRTAAAEINPAFQPAFNNAGLASLFGPDMDKLKAMAAAAGNDNFAAFVAAPQQPAGVQTSLRSGHVDGLPTGPVSVAQLLAAKQIERGSGVARKIRTGLGREGVGKGRFTPVFPFKLLDQPMPLGTEQKTLSPAEQRREAARLQPRPLPNGRPPMAGPSSLMTPTFTG